MKLFNKVRGCKRGKMKVKGFCGELLVTGFWLLASIFVTQTSVLSTQSFCFALKAKRAAPQTKLLEVRRAAHQTQCS
jgi:hypothetical protein